MESVTPKSCLSSKGERSGSDLYVVDRQATGPAAYTTGSKRGCDRRFDALTVALGQASEGKWYASTLQLQLASFGVCVACRRVRTLRVIVDERMPLSLWGNEESSDESPKAQGSRQQPPLRAAGVVWKIPSCFMVPLLSEGTLLREVGWMQRDDRVSNATQLSSCKYIEQPAEGMLPSCRNYFKEVANVCRQEIRPVNGVQILGRFSWPPALRQLSILCKTRRFYFDDWVSLPSTLEHLHLSGRFDDPIDYVFWQTESISWPVSLKHLSLGGCFNQPIDSFTWPPSLTHLAFGDWFNQPIADVEWPASLLRLAFGSEFAKSIVGVVWPPSLLQLTFDGSVRQSIAGVVWPASLRHLALVDIRKGSITSIVWPPSLVRLRLGSRFNEPITEVVWPASLTRLVLGVSFNQSITQVVWPVCLKHLVFGNDFNTPITEVAWPASLKRLIFGEGFNQPIAGVVWPVHVNQLVFGDSFNYPITDAVWPSSLDRLVLGCSFNHPIAEVAWPASLKLLEFGNSFNHPISDVVWPNALQALAFGRGFDQSIDGVVWPAALRCLTFITMPNLQTAAVLCPSIFDIVVPWGLCSDRFDDKEDQIDWPHAIDQFYRPLDWLI